MKFFILNLFFLVILAMHSFAQANKPGIKDSKKNMSGLYAVVKGNSKEKGFQLLNSNDFYLVDTKNGFLLNGIDNIGNEYDKNCKCELLTIKFNTTKIKELRDFSLIHQQQKIGLVVNGILYVVASMVAPIYNGGLTFGVNFNKTQIDHLQSAILVNRGKR